MTLTFPHGAKHVWANVDLQVYEQISRNKVRRNKTF